MANTTLPGVLLKGVAASRPAANAVAAGTLYSATDTNVVTQSDGVSTWSTYLTAAAATRASLGLDTTDSPQFAGLNIGAATDTTVTRTGAGDIAVEGNAIYRAGGTDVPIGDGGTGASTKAAAFDALSPLTTSGDILYGGASGTGTRLAKGTDGQVLTLASGLPSWAAGGAGGGLAQSFTGYNTVGATWTATVANRMWAKPITLAATSHFRSVDLHIRPNQDSTSGALRAGLVTDIAGVPGLLIAEGTATGLQLFSGATSGFPGTGRWFSIAIGPTVAAGNYWIVWDFFGVVLDIANDTSGGGDVRWDLGFDGFSGGHTALTQTTTAIRHSVRASILA